MSCLFLIKTDNKPDVVDVSIDRCRQKLWFDKNRVNVNGDSIFIERLFLMPIDSHVDHIQYVVGLC